MLHTFPLPTGPIMTKISPFFASKLTSVRVCLILSYREKQCNNASNTQLEKEISFNVRLRTTNHSLVENIITSVFFMECEQ